MKRIAYGLVICIPVLALAQSSTLTIVPFLDNVNSLVLNPLIALLFGLSFLYFAYGIVKFLRLDAADKTRQEARNAILWGFVGMLIMFSVHGIIQYVILPSFGLSPSDIQSSGAQGFLGL